MKDRQGRDFDPEIHVTDDDGNPVQNSDGTLKCQPGRGHKTHKERRRRRSEMGPQLRLAAEEREGFVRRWVIDEPGRLDRFTKQNDYEYVLDDGQPVRKITGRDATGKEQYSYLLEIPKEYYEEDQKAKRPPDPTKMREARVGENEYIPGGGNSALR